MSLAVGSSISVADALRGAGRRIAGSEARLLLERVSGLSRQDLIAHPDRPLEEAVRRGYDALVRRREGGEPIAYIVGEREFYGLALRVTSDVLIPRPETEHLVESALERLPRGESHPVLELGTGSGAVAIALARARPELHMLATDVSEGALEIARHNARIHGVAVELVRSDWFAVLGARRFRLILANPPYVASGDPHLREGDVRFEPRLALDGGADGLACVRRIADEARARLEPGGWLVLEHGYDQGPACERLLREFGYDEIGDIPDLSGHPRVVAARWSG